MSQFPIDPLLEQICSAVRPGETVLLQAPPGAGKTTRVPLALIGALKEGQGVLEDQQKIWMIEPRGGAPTTPPPPPAPPRGGH
ncbi:MAG: hypothetical protein VYC94_02520, partial [Cyanobacteriota bacterium]|nr:hypothetical protein [Cyanobacteriota bacterium]